jgi:clan AA aspartic protease (TIGR02281 family)
VISYVLGYTLGRARNPFLLVAGTVCAVAVWGAFAVVAFLSHSSPDAALVAPLPDAYGRPAQHQMVIPADGDNQCYVEGEVAGRRYRFLMDSGAGGYLFFSAKDARRLGLNPATLEFDHEYQEWGGTVRGAHVTLPRFRVSGFSLDRVRATIDETGGVVDDGPLMGSQILKLLHFRVVDGSCIISW